MPVNSLVKFHSPVPTHYASDGTTLDFACRRKSECKRRDGSQVRVTRYRSVSLYHKAHLCASYLKTLAVPDIVASPDSLVPFSVRVDAAEGPAFPVGYHSDSGSWTRIRNQRALAGIQ